MFVKREIPGVWDSHKASGEETVVVDGRNATAEIKDLFQHLSHSSHGPGSQLPGSATKTGQTDHLLPGFLLLQLLLQRMKAAQPVRADGRMVLARGYVHVQEVSDRRLKFLTMEQILAPRPKVPVHKDWRSIKLQEVDYKSEKMKFL